MDLHPLKISGEVLIHPQTQNLFLLVLSHRNHINVLLDHKTSDKATVLKAPKKNRDHRTTIPIAVPRAGQTHQPPAHAMSLIWVRARKLCRMIQTLKTMIWAFTKKTINTYKHQQWWFGFLFWCMEQIYEPLTKQTDYIGFSLSKKNILNGLETFSRNSLRYLGKNIDQTDTNITFVRTEQFAPVKPPITTMLSWYSASSSCLPTAQRCNGNWSLTERGPAKRRSRWESKSY
jgi:hypothetical protein